MNPTLTTRGVFAPHTWSSPQIARMFKNLSALPLASTLEEIDNQVSTTFHEALAWMVQYHPHTDPFIICPESNDGLKIPNKEIFLSGTTKEFFFFGANGALEIRKQGPAYKQEIKDLLAIRYNFKQLYLCYSKLGADGCNVWGDDMFDRSQ